jgi:hypothetical protein
LRCELGEVLLLGAPELDPAHAQALGVATFGVEVRTGALVSDIGPHHVTVGGERIHAHTTLWAAGNAASPLGKELHTRQDRAGRVEVLHRTGRRGLGRSYIDGITKSIHDPVDLICRVNHVSALQYQIIRLGQSRQCQQQDENSRDNAVHEKPSRW